MFGFENFSYVIVRFIKLGHLKLQLLILIISISSYLCGKAYNSRTIFHNFNI